MSGTTIDAIYTALGALVAASTGRHWWDKRGVQAQPQGPYVTIYVTAGDTLQNQVVDEILLDTPGPDGETFKERPWGTCLIDVQVEFVRSGANGDTAQVAAKRFDNALQLTARYFDLWEICGLSGGTRFTDISAIFRADIEPRARIDFKAYANLMDEPLPAAGAEIFNIEKQPVNFPNPGGELVMTFTGAGLNDISYSLADGGEGGIGVNCLLKVATAIIPDMTPTFTAGEGGGGANDLSMSGLLLAPGEVDFLVKVSSLGVPGVLDPTFHGTGLNDLTVGGSRVPPNIFTVEIDSVNNPGPSTDPGTGSYEFSGTGVDDLVYIPANALPGTVSFTALVRISSVGATDRIGFSFDGGTTWADGYPISNGASPCYGVDTNGASVHGFTPPACFVTFESDTGHTLYDQWTIIYVAPPPVPYDTFKVGSSVHVTITGGTQSVPGFSGLTLKFNSISGHTLHDSWTVSDVPTPDGIEFSFDGGTTWTSETPVSQTPQAVIPYPGLYFSFGTLLGHGLDDEWHVHFEAVADTFTVSLDGGQSWADEITMTTFPQPVPGTLLLVGFDAVMGHTAGDTWKVSNVLEAITVSSPG